MTDKETESQCREVTFSGSLLLVADKLCFGFLLGPWTDPGSASPTFGFCLDWLTLCPEDGLALLKTEAEEHISAFLGLCSF